MQANLLLLGKLKRSTLVLIFISPVLTLIITAPFGVNGQNLPGYGRYIARSMGKPSLLNRILNKLSGGYQNSLNKFPESK